MELTSLPADIVTDILVNLPDLSTLYAVINCNKRMYSIFNDRRTLFLSSVYGNVVTSSIERILSQKSETHLRHLLFLDSFAKDIKVLQNFGQNTKLPSRDALALQQSTWKVLISFKIPVWYLTALGETLIDVCLSSLQTDFILGMAENVLQSLLKTEFPALSAFDQRRYKQAHFVNRLAKACYSLGRPVDASRLLYVFSLSEGFRSDLVTMPTLLKLLKENPGTAYERELVAEISMRYIRNRREHASIPGHDRLSTTMSYGLTFTSECYLHFVYLELGKIDEVAALLQGAIRTLSDSTNTPTLRRAITMARRTIKALKQMHRNQQVLEYRRIIFERLRSVGLIHAEVSVLVAWASDYATEAYRFGRPRLAISIREQLVSSLSILPNDSHTAFRYQLARKALLRAYLDTETPQKDWSSQILDFVSPRDADREEGPASHRRTVNTNLPIMT